MKIKLLIPYGEIKRDSFFKVGKVHLNNIHIIENGVVKKDMLE